MRLRQVPKGLGLKEKARGAKFHLWRFIEDDEGDEVTITDDLFS